MDNNSSNNLKERGLEKTENKFFELIEEWKDDHKNLNTKFMEVHGIISFAMLFLSSVWIFTVFNIFTFLSFSFATISILYIASYFKKKTYQYEIERAYFKISENENWGKIKLEEKLKLILLSFSWSISRSTHTLKDQKLASIFLILSSLAMLVVSISHG